MKYYLLLTDLFSLSSILLFIMFSRFRFEFAINSTFYFPKTNNSQLISSFNISSSFWQPYIDVTVNDTNNTAVLSGPLLGIIIELAESMSLRFVLMMNIFSNCKNMY